MNSILPTPPEKDKPWFWILGAAVLVFLCQAVVVVMALGYFVFKKQGIALPGLLFPSPTPTPNRLRATVAPTRALLRGPLTVIPADSNSGQYDTLQNLAADWQPSSGPDVKTWQVQVPASDPVLILMGWCAADQSTLDNNYRHLAWVMLVDEVAVPAGSLTVNESSDSQGEYCRDYSGVIMSWTAGPHKIQTTMHIDEEINDGWNSYPAGDYVDIYQITVVR